MTSRTWLIVLAVVIVLAYPVLSTVLYTVNERELAVVLQFGEPVASRTKAGLYAKLPLVQDVVRLPRTLQLWHGVGDDQKLVDVPSADGKKIEATVWAIWRITDPVVFVQTLRTLANGQNRVKDFVRGATRDAITRHNLAEVVRSSDRELTYSFLLEAFKDQTDGTAAPVVVELPEQMAVDAVERVTKGRQTIIDEIRSDAQRRLASDGTAAGTAQTGRGVELVDVGISRIEFVQQVRDAAFNRQIAFMESIASKYTAEGELRKQEILNRTLAEVQKIQGEGVQEANVLRGNVDAEIIDLYAKAMSEAGDFFRFVRTLELYSTSLGGDTRLILSTDNDLLRLLKGIGEPRPESAVTQSAP